jgi:hypothetical protein
MKPPLLTDLVTLLRACPTHVVAVTPEQLQARWASLRLEQVRPENTAALLAALELTERTASGLFTEPERTQLRELALRAAERYAHQPPNQLGQLLVSALRPE